MRSACLPLIAAVAVGIAGCGGLTPAQSEQRQAAGQAEAMLSGYVPTMRKLCHESSLPRERSLSCHRQIQGWDCPFLFADGTSGSAIVGETTGLSYVNC